MKKLLFFVSAFLFAAPLFAQIDQDEIQLFQTLFGKPKKEIVAGFVKIDGAKQDLFWKLYNEYEAERKKLGEKRFVELNNYVKNYSSLSSKEIEKIMEDIILLTTSQDKLIIRYYKKMKKTIGINMAAQFYQIEWYLQSQIHTSLLESIPTINELEVKK